MINFYWPGKNVPEWLQQIAPAGEGFKKGTIFHNGFGIITRVKNDFLVLGLAGTFIKIVGMHQAIVRGAPFTGGSVRYYTSVKCFIQGIKSANRS